MAPSQNPADLTVLLFLAKARAAFSSLTLQGERETADGRADATEPRREALAAAPRSGSGPQDSEKHARRSPDTRPTSSATRGGRRRIGSWPRHQSHAMVSSIADLNHAQTSLNSASLSQPAEAKSWMTKTFSPAPLDQQATSSLSCLGVDG